MGGSIKNLNASGGLASLVSVQPFTTASAGSVTGTVRHTAKEPDFGHLLEANLPKAQTGIGSANPGQAIEEALPQGGHAALRGARVDSDPVHLRRGFSETVLANALRGKDTLSSKSKAAPERSNEKSKEPRTANPAEHGSIVTPVATPVAVHAPSSSSEMGDAPGEVAQTPANKAYVVAGNVPDLQPEDALNTGFVDPFKPHAMQLPGEGVVTEKINSQGVKADIGVAPLSSGNRISLQIENALGSPEMSGFENAGRDLSTLPAAAQHPGEQASSGLSSPVGPEIDSPDLKPTAASIMQKSDDSAAWRPSAAAQGHDSVRTAILSMPHTPGSEPATGKITAKGERSDQAGTSQPAAAQETAALASPIVSSGAINGTSTSGQSATAAGVGVAANPFSHMDAAAQPSARLLHANARQVDIGVNDPAHGWLEIRAQNAAGEVSASLSTSTADAQTRLHTELPGIAQYLAERDIDVHHLTVTQAAESSTPGHEYGQGARQDSEQANAQQGGQRAPGHSDDDARIDGGERVSSRSRDLPGVTPQSIHARQDAVTATRVSVRV